MNSSRPKLPEPLFINGLSYIPPPSAEEFNAEFAGVLPEGITIQSSWGQTRFYDFSPTADSSARKVLLLHGGGTSAIGLAPLARVLTAAGNHVVAYDLWGHGNSSTPLEAHTPALWHAQLFELLSHLRWSSANFVGFSLGGTILATFVALHPHVAESVVFICPAGILKSPEQLLSMTDELILEAVEGSNPQAKEGWKERLKLGIVETEPVEIWQNKYHKGHAATLISAFRYGGVFDQLASYQKIALGHVKVLMILGEKDTVFDAETLKKELLEVGWKGEITIVEGATHGIVRSHAHEVAHLAEGFWSSLV
jgi:pimeloyl-ACP methyl ester carboxylesterase